MDHSAGYPKPKSSSERLFHNSCGGAITRDDYGWWSSDYAIWRCGGCSQKWSNQVMSRFTADQLADRFHVRPLPSNEVSMLVEVQEGRERFTKTVSAEEFYRDQFEARPGRPRRYTRCILPGLSSGTR